MKIGIIGLGRMGLGFAYRLHKEGFAIQGYDPSPEAQQHARKEKIVIAPTMNALVQECSVIFLLVPAGLIDQIIAAILAHVQKNSIIIDAGNSKYTDSQQRAALLAHHTIHFIDCGTSGGVHGKEAGYCLMIGGDKKIYDQLVPAFTALAEKNGCAYVGPSGAGHFVKTVHNGIEYGLLQAYGEGFHLLREGPFKDIDLAQISDLWNHGAVIRSWILELAHTVLEKDQKMTEICGALSENGTGQWTVDTAHEYKIPVPVIEKSVEVRAWSRKTGGNYATKLIALLRNAFGGHTFVKK